MLPGSNIPYIFFVSGFLCDCERRLGWLRRAEDDPRCLLYDVCMAELLCAAGGRCISQMSPNDAAPPPTTHFKQTHFVSLFYTKLHLRPVAVPFTQRQTAPFPSREDAVLTTYNALFGYEGTLLTNNDVFFGLWGAVICLEAALSASPV